MTPTATMTPTGTLSLTATNTPTGTPTLATGGGPTAPDATATASPTATTTRTPTATTPSPTATRTATPPGPGAVAAPTSVGITEPQREVLGIAVERVRARREQQPTAPVQVPQPPVQLPPVAEGIFNFLVSAFAGSQPVTTNEEPVCGLALEMGSTVEPSAVQVGDSVDFTYTVTNAGTVALADVHVASALPGGLSFVSASSAGAVEPETGYIAWELRSGLAAGASTTLAVSATITDPGQWENNACSAGLDADGNDVGDCTSVTVVASVPTLTPTPTSTAAPTPSAIPTGTLQPAPLPITPGPEPMPLPITPGPEPMPLPVTPEPAEPTPEPEPVPLPEPTPESPEPVPLPAPLPAPEPAPQPTP
jgi:uncharacterized repeat protein (TIGR01451 family)